MAKLTNNGPKLTTLGLDIGYGVVKAITDKEAVVFPALWGYAREIKFKAEEIAAKYPGDQIHDDTGSYFVGELALSQLRPAEQRRLRGRTANEKELGNIDRLRLAKVAIGKLFPNHHNGEAVHLHIATGLPVDHMRGSGDLKAALIGQHLIETDSTRIVANITEVMVMPQPYGTIYRNMLTERGEVNPCHAYNRTGVVDVGTYTVDIALDDDGEYIDTYSGSVEAGVHLAHEIIATQFEADYGQKPGYREVEHILRTQCFKYRNQPVDYTQVVNEATEPLRAATLNLMGEKWQAGANVDVVYLSGGGAGLVYDDVKRAYPQTELVEGAQLANARGYLNYALFASK